MLRVPIISGILKKTITKVHRQEVLLVIRHREIQRLVEARRLRSSFNFEVCIKRFSLIVRATV